jgi:tetratricopeptide (TPR) repeat protein
MLYIGLRFLLVFMLFFATTECVYAQPSLPASSPDEQLAAQYYSSGEYDKAVVYYEKLYNKNPIALYYNYYLNCLLFTKNYRKAEKLVGKQIKNYPSDLRLRVDQGRIYTAQNDPEKAKKEYREAIAAIDKNTRAIDVIELSNAFQGINELDFAIESLKRGRKELAPNYTFNEELAAIYLVQKDYIGMVNECLDLVAIDARGNQQRMQNRFQTWMDGDAEEKIEPILKTELLHRSQKEPDQLVWAEMLMWLFVQQKDFRAAMVQAKAIDKRTSGQGFQVMELSETAISNREYDAAMVGYDYVIGLGVKSGYYEKARIDRNKARLQQITGMANYTQNDLLQLETDMKTVLTELGKSIRTVDLMRSLAHLQAFYLFNTSDAVQLLEEAITLAAVDQQEQANCKLELGDVLLLDGQVWEASLRYSQVEKVFKNESIGQEAKYRNAKVAFYMGDFEWSQVQLNVLKGSTEKLIANDAMYLSILITDNFALDSNPEPLMLFANADLMLFQNRYDRATLYLDSINQRYPAHSLGDDVLFLRYRIAFRQQKWIEAAEFLQLLLQNYSQDVLGDDAQFRMAELYDYHLNDKDKAMQLYQELLTKFPGSLYVVDARKQFRNLRGDKLTE